MRIKPELWILYSVAAAFFWGTWGVVAKLISDQVSPFTNHLLFSVGMLFTLPLLIKKSQPLRPTEKVFCGGLWRVSLLLWGTSRFISHSRRGG